MAIDKEMRAVNRMLRSIDVAQINSWDEADEIVEGARDELYDTSVYIQSVGWYFNKRTIEYSPDATTNEIVLPEDVLSASHSSDNNYVIQNGKLYDLENNTYEITSAQELDVILEFDFQYLPPAAQEYIISKATYNFQENVIGAKGINQNLYDKMTQAKVKLEQEDMANSDTSLFSSSDLSGFINS